MAPRIKHTVTGNLVEDPKRVPYRNDPSKSFVALRVAENQYKRAPEGSEHKYEDAPSNFYDVAVFEPYASHVYESLVKGDTVTVSGDYTSEAYASRDGAVGTNHKIAADTVSVDLRRSSVVVNRPVASHTSETEFGATAETAADLDPEADRGLTH